MSDSAECLCFLLRPLSTRPRSVRKPLDAHARLPCGLLSRADLRGSSAVGVMFSMSAQNDGGYARRAVSGLALTDGLAPRQARCLGNCNDCHALIHAGSAAPRACADYRAFIRAQRVVYLAPTTGLTFCRLGNCADCRAFICAYHVVPPCADRRASTPPGTAFASLR